MANEKIKDLKATAYDIISNIEFLQSKLKEVNAQIEQIFKEEKEKENGSNNADSNN